MSLPRLRPSEGGAVSDAVTIALITAGTILAFTGTFYYFAWRIFHWWLRP
jgi:hypothetical protein